MFHKHVHIWTNMYCVYFKNSFHYRENIIAWSNPGRPFVCCNHCVVWFRTSSASTVVVVKETTLCSSVKGDLLSVYKGHTVHIQTSKTLSITIVYTCPSFLLRCTDRRCKQKYAKFKILTRRTIIIKYDERKYNVYDIANLHPQYKSQQTLRKGWNRDKVECFCIEHPSVCKRRNHSVQKVIRLWILLAYEKLMCMYEKKFTPLMTNA